MTRLPTPGSDTGKWGEILNEFLSQAHTADGKLKTDSVTAGQLAPGSVVTPAIADGAVTNSKLDIPTKASLTKADTAVQPGDLGTAATLDVGTTTGTVAAGDDSRITGAAQKSANLSDLADAATARANLGIPARSSRNILDYGVSTGTATSQTAAIKAALDAYPGETFYFPPGDYRLDTQLDVTASNSLILDPDARIYAGAAMGTLINYDNGLSVSGYASDKAIIGGLLDAALLADKALAIGSVLRLTLGSGLTIKDPISRGIWFKASGAEVIANNIRLHNTGTTNVSDNVAIEADMADCQVSDVITRDFTVGVWDKGGNVWTDVHPWIGTTAQLTARYASSVAFLLASSRHTVLSRPYADTYRYSFRTQASSGYGKVRIVEPRVFCNTGNLTDAIAAASPGVVFDIADGAQIFARGGTYQGHGVTPHALTAGSAIRFNHRDWIDEVPGSVSGLAEYRRGVQMGTSAFAASVFGSTSGAATLTTNSCTMEARDGTAEYRFILVGTLPGSGWAGRLRIGLPGFPTGATATGTGVGTISYLSSSVAPTVFNNVTAGFSAGLSAPGTTVFQLNTVGAGSASEPVTDSCAGASIQIWGRLTVPFTYPS